MKSGSRTLKDAINEAMRDWVTNLATTHYLVGSAIGPHPFPTIVRDYQCVIGREIKAQFSDAIGKLPDVVVACVGGGSNAIGAFYDFINEEGVRLVGVEAGGEGIVYSCTDQPRCLWLGLQVSIRIVTAPLCHWAHLECFMEYEPTSCNHPPVRSSKRTQ